MKVKFLYVVFTMMLLVAPTVMAQSVYDYEYNSQKKMLPSHLETVQITQ